MKLVNKTPAGSQHVYDLEVEHGQNFYANKINVHNCTGLKVPTIAVATGGGVSVIRHDGVIANVTVSDDSLVAKNIFFTKDNSIGYYGNYAQYSPRIIPIPVSSYSQGTHYSRGSATTRWYTQAATPGDLKVLGVTPGEPQALISYSKSTIAVGEALGVSLVRENNSSPKKGMMSYVTNTYNTGHLIGDIRRCFLADTATGSVSMGAELVDLGTLAPTYVYPSNNGGVSSWDAATKTVQTTVVGGQVDYPRFGFSIGMSTSKRYSVYGVLTGSLTSIVNIRLAGSSQNYNCVYNSTTGVFYANMFPGSGVIEFVVNGTVLSDITISSLSIREVPTAGYDRSYKAAGANIYGTLTASAVNTGNSLVAYSGFSGSNYIQEPFSADLDFGTGEWSVGAWVNVPTGNAAAATIACREHSSGPYIRLGIDSTNKLTATTFDGTTTRTVTTSAAYNTATWTKARATYTTDGTLSIMVNGVNVASTTGAPLLTLNSRYNLLNFSEQFDNAYWTKDAVSILQDSILAPNGTPTADKVIENSANTAHYLYRNGLTNAGQRITLSVCLKAGERTKAWIYAYAVSQAVAYFDLSAGTVLSATGLDSPTASIYPVGNGWYRCSMTVTPSGTGGVGFGPTTANGTVSYTGDGTSGIYAWGAQLELGSVATDYQRIDSGTGPTLAPLTIGNSYALDAPFPGSIALLKFSATVPTQEQALWMYEQEKQLFRKGAQCVLPSSGNVLDLAYDDETDTWSALQATHESTWSGLVRTSTQTPSAGSFAKCVAGSGNKLLARTTTNPGVDIQMPARNLRAELRRRREAMNANQDIVVFDYFGGFTATTTLNSTALTSVAASLYPSTTNLIGCAISGTGIPVGTVITGISGTTIYMSKAATANGSAIQISTTDFNLPVGYTAKAVMTAGTLQKEGATSSWVRLFDGFRETIRFAVAPGYNAWVQLQAAKEVA